MQNTVAGYLKSIYYCKKERGLTVHHVTMHNLYMLSQSIDISTLWVNLWFIDCDNI